MDKGNKFDKDKPISGIIQDFGLALLEVSALATKGAKKYARGSWLHVENGQQRYTDALCRHLLQEGTQKVDEEMELGHDVAVAWNALARLELRLRREHDEKVIKETRAELKAKAEAEAEDKRMACPFHFYATPRKVFCTHNNLGGPLPVCMYTVADCPKLVLGTTVIDSAVQPEFKTPISCNTCYNKNACATDRKQYHANRHCRHWTGIATKPRVNPVGPVV